MRDFIAKISLTALFALAIFSASAAEKVTFEASSPLTVAVGEAFRVEFALNAYPDKGTFKAPSFDGFDVIAGPAKRPTYRTTYYARARTAEAAIACVKRNLVKRPPRAARFSARLAGPRELGCVPTPTTERTPS